MYFYYFRNPECCFLALCQIICLFVYLFYFQKSTNVMFFWHCAKLFVYLCIFIISGSRTVVFWHCARLFVYLCIYFISRSPQMLCFLALCQIICLFMYFYYFRNPEMLFSGTVPDYLFICVSILFPEVHKCYVFWHCAKLFVYLCILLFRIQKCYVFWHCARLFVYSCIYFISRSPGMLCFQALCTLQDRFISVVSFWNDITMSWIKTNTVKQTLFASSVTHRSTSRYIVDQIVWQWIE